MRETEGSEKIKSPGKILQEKALLERGTEDNPASVTKVPP